MPLGVQMKTIARHVLVKTITRRISSEVFTRIELSSDDDAERLRANTSQEINYVFV